MKILLVDDDPFVRQLLHDQLTERGYDVQVRGNVDDAIAALTVETYGLLITDIVMPHKDGGELMRYVHDNNIKMPMIAITGGISNAQKDYENYADLFADKTFVKPIVMDELLSAVEELKSK